MSIPRDLKVDTSRGYGTRQDQRGLHAWAAPVLTVQARHASLLGIPINHVINIDFGGFRQAVDRARLRLRRRRPPLLQRQLRPAASRLRRDRRPAGLPEAVRLGRARLRALPPRRHRPRARRAPAGLPAPGQGSRSASSKLVRRPQQAGRASSARYMSTDIRGTRRRSCELLKLVLYSAGIPIQRGPLPRRTIGDRPTSTATPEQHPRRPSTSSSSPRPSSGRARARRARRAQEGASASAPRRQARRRRARGRASRRARTRRSLGAARPASPFYYPKLRRAASATYEPSRASATYAIQTSGRSATGAYRHRRRARARRASTTASRARPGGTRRSSTTRPRHADGQRPRAAALRRRQPAAPRRLADAARRRTGSRTRCADADERPDARDRRAR